MTINLKPTRAKGTSTIGPGHDGRSRAFAKPGEPSLAVHHDPQAARIGDNPDATAHALGHRGHATAAVVNGKTVRAPGAIDVQPRAGAPKAMHPVSVHNGMHSRQIAGMNAGGMSHPTALVDGGQTIANSAAASPIHATPLAAGALPKSNKPIPRPAMGMRHRHTDRLHGGDAGENIARAGKPDTNALHELGRAIMREALEGSAPDDRFAFGHLPDSTNEQS